MEILQKIWSILTTQNLELSNLLVAPLTFIEMLVGMLLFTTLLNIKATRKQKIIYLIFITIWAIICNIFIPKPYSLYLNMIVWSGTILLVFKVSLLKSIIAEIIPFIIFAIFDTIFGKIFFILFKLPYETIVAIPIYRILIMLLMYLAGFLVYLVVKKLNFSIHLLDNMDKKDKLLLISNLILGTLSICTQFYLIVYYFETLPIAVTILSGISLVSYFFISIYSITRTTKLEIANQNLEQSKQYNKTLEILYDNMKAFKHDFNNIVQAIGGYVDSGDTDGLKKYYSELQIDCNKVNNLTALSPAVVNNPAVYSLLASKYYKADENGIKINLEFFLDLNTLNMKIYEFTRILGILLDNAIEATIECEEKIINVTLRSDFKVKRQLLIIENTYKEKDVDIDKIFDKGYSSKEKNTGLGLWEVRQILKKNNNLNLYTTKTEQFFKQQLEIYPKEKLI